MQYPQHLKPEQRFLRIIFIGVLSVAGPAGEFSKWCVSGVAAILALLIANLGSVSNILSQRILKWGIIFLSISMFFGVVVTQLGIGIRMGIVLIESLYAEFAKPEAQAALAGSTLAPDEMINDMVAPFLWPLKQIILRAAAKGKSDFLGGEKGFIRMLCYQTYASFVQTTAVIIGLIIFACGIK